MSAVIEQGNAEDQPDPWAYAERQLKDLTSLPDGWDGEDAPPVSPMAAKRVMRLIRAITDSNSVFPTLVTDYEGGVTAEWRSGRQRVAIEIDSTGEAYLYANDPEGNSVLEDLVPFNQEAYRKVRIARNELSRMSARVSRINPNWRCLFQ
ncbi:hypothetical protein [Streptomyces yangpuensis]|uniref:hypothetical protein n=1 Tax=Streptomyces yangpuensis TaxID=1648182 RepID=UPI0012FF5104|nr:hypothetical protein [Streptomyces yangpuensis]